jgi:hypothetical protein
MIDTTAYEQKADTALATVRQAAPQIVQARCITRREAQWFADAGKRFATMRKDLTKDRDQFCKPLRAVAKRIADRYKPAIDGCQAVEDHVKEQIDAFQFREAAKAQAALAEATTPEEVTATVAAVVPATPQGTAQVETWGFRVVDTKLIPADYWLLDEKRLAREAKAMKGGLKIPGIEPVREMKTRWK